MKKFALVSVIAAILILASSTVAMASLDPLFVGWTEAAPNNTSLGTPHADYQLSTQKCAVCHSVHNAPATVTAGATGQTELLLRSSAADACTYCHISTGTGVIRLYNAVAANYNVDSQYNHSYVAGCTKCHSVHSANTIAGNVATKILRDGQNVNGTDYVYQDEYTTYLTAKNGSANEDTYVRDEQVTVFCTKCHDNYSGASETTVTSYGWNGAAYETRSLKHHPLKSAATNFIAQGATNSNSSVAVAFADAFYCSDCHDAGLTGQADGNPKTVANSFPHYTPNYAAFMGIATSTAGTWSQTTDASADGACLKCHRSATTGVGTLY